MLSLGIVLLLALWKSHAAGELPTSWETVFGFIGTLSIAMGLMMYCSAVIAWWERWVFHRRVVYPVGSLTQGGE